MASRIRLAFLLRSRRADGPGGRHDTLRKRSRRWAQKGTWQRLFEAVQEPDLDWVMLDSTVVRAHAQAAGSQKKPRRRRGPRPQPRRADNENSRRRGRAGQPVARGARGPGQQADCRRVADLLAAAEGAGNVLTDKAYGTDAVVAAVEALGAQAVIYSKKNRKVVRLIDRNLYRDRNKVGRFFSRLKQLLRLR